MNNLNLPAEKMDALLKMAGQKLGKNPADLKSQIESGQLGKAISNLDPKVQGQINSLMSNPKALEAMMSNEKIRNLDNGFMGGAGK